MRIYKLRLSGRNVTIHLQHPVIFTWLSRESRNMSNCEDGARLASLGCVKDLIFHSESEGLQLFL